MMIAIPDLLDAAQVRTVRDLIDAAEWIDDEATADRPAAATGGNLTLAETSSQSKEASTLIMDALASSALFIAAALPLKLFPPAFSSQVGHHSSGVFVDNAIRIQRSTDYRVRSDIAAVLFLEDPDAYDGGELVIDSSFGVREVKLAAGHMILYPASSRRRVEPVTRGRRVTSVFWIESMVRDDSARSILFELDNGIQAIAARSGHDDPTVVQLTGVYHNLLRRWADA